jgi:hypothetical protein
MGVVMVVVVIMIMGIRVLVVVVMVVIMLVVVVMGIRMRVVMVMIVVMGIRMRVVISMFMVVRHSVLLNKISQAQATPPAPRLRGGGRPPMGLVVSQARRVRIPASSPLHAGDDHTLGKDPLAKEE